jgi:uncharacterized membrane protein
MPTEWKDFDPQLATDDVASFKSLEAVFSNVLNIAVTIAGLILFIMLLIGGFNYLTSGGDPEKLKKAGATIGHALLGFILLIASWFIIKLLSQFTGVDLTTFEIPGP